ncbi:MAG TPA: HAMP domain-containing sensor histidine kinase [Methylomirabilota bacterium]|nr:HAMP domain-containing sensor histidine kinase [Methylomirabilota bacterium]
MSFRTKIFLIFLVTVLASVSVVAWSVVRYTRNAFEEMDAQRTDALLTQFRTEFSQRADEVVHRVEKIADGDAALKMAIALTRPNPDLSLFVHDANGAAQDQGLDYVEFVRADGTLISSAQYLARVGYKNDWVTGRDWSGAPAFLKREELPNEVALSLTAVRSQPQVPNTLFIIGGRRLDRNFLATLVLPAGMHALLYQNLQPGFLPAALSDSSGDVRDPERYAPIIEQMQRRPEPSVHTIQWSQDAADTESIHAMPLLGRNNELLGVLLVSSPRREMVLLIRRIERIAALAGAAALFVGLLLTWWVSARVTRPVEELAEGARSVAAGDWDTRLEPRGSDEIAQLAGAFNDMTRTLSAQREKLVQAERVAAWRELARRLAHELRNPLFPLQITLENLQRARALPKDQFNEVFQESTTTLKAELGNLNTIIGRFSDFSKMPAPEMQRVNVNEAVRAAVRLFEPQFNAVGRPAITPEYYLAESLPEIDADPDLLHRALQNLVLNALDAMPGGGVLTLRTSAHDGVVRIDVADSGQGLTPEECSRLFTPYYTSKQHGTGLGLAIVQSVVSDHGGTISVTSEPGHGATFHIELPLRSRKPRVAAAEPKAETAPENAPTGTAA